MSKRNITLTLDERVLDELKDHSRKEHRPVSLQVQKWIEEKIAEEKSKKSKAVTA